MKRISSPPSSLPQHRRRLLPQPASNVVEDTEKFCSVIDAAPSKNLKVLGDKQATAAAISRAGLEGPECKALPG